VPARTRARRTGDGHRPMPRAGGERSDSHRTWSYRLTRHLPAVYPRPLAGQPPPLRLRRAVGNPPSAPAPASAFGAGLEREFGGRWLRPPSPAYTPRARVATSVCSCPARHREGWAPAMRRPAPATARIVLPQAAVRGSYGSPGGCQIRARAGEGSINASPTATAGPRDGEGWGCAMRTQPPRPEPRSTGRSPIIPPAANVGVPFVSISAAAAADLRGVILGRDRR
jgi:hypothetical protein